MMDCLHDAPVPSFSYPPNPSNDRPASIPLHCNICQKKPTFSDISHLLTHIASKGHLSTYYKIKVKASTEDGARRLIEEYDSWYATWRIESLMSERMNTKETRRKQKARQSALSVTATHSHQASLHALGPDFGLEDQITPLLDDTMIKQEDSDHNIPFGYIIQPFQNPLQSFTTPSWLTFPYTYEPSHPKAQACDEHDDQGLATASLYSPTPMRINVVPRNTENTIYGIDGVEADEDNRSMEYNRLKGILWPGMDMFDSATPDMKRKRNQKKSMDVVDRLEALSKGIEATEVVYSAEGTIQKARPITGFPHSDSSPMKGEKSPSPKKPRPTARRKPLAPKNPNARSNKASQRARASRRGLGRGSKKARDENGDSHTTVVKATTHAKRVAKRKQPTAPEPPSLIPETHGIEYLTSAFQYHSPEQTEQNFTGHFRPAMDWTGYSHVSFDGNSGYTHQLPTEANMLPAWDFIGSDAGMSLMNPLFMESNTAEHDDDDDDDDQQTISAPVSDS